MESQEYQAYIVPDILIEGERENLVLKSKFMTKLMMMEGNEGFLIEGERKHKWQWLNNLMEGVPYKTKNEFINSLKEAVQALSVYGFEEDLEKFAQRQNLRVSRLELVGID